MGTVSVPVPETALTASFSPIPRMAPPPFGSERVGNGLASRSAALLPDEPEARAAAAASRVLPGPPGGAASTALDRLDRVGSPGPLLTAYQRSEGELRRYSNNY